MHYKKELTYKDLLMNFDFLPEFKDTSEISGYKGIIGQDRAIEAVEFGLSIYRKGYNMYVSGSMGTGKRSYILDKLKRHAKELPTPHDWCYVYNFHDPYKPKALKLNSGTAYNFKEDIDELINLLYKDVPKSFSDHIYERERNDIIDKYKKMISKVVSVLQQRAGENSFKVKNTSDGFAFVPISGNEEMSEKEYDELEEDKKEEINSKVSELKLVALEVIKKTKEIKKEMANELKELDTKVALTIMDDSIKNLRKVYGYNEDILDYIEDLEIDIIENIDIFIDYEDEKDSEEFDESFFKRYSVNVFISSRDVEGAPVIYEEQPEYSSLIGSIEYENKQGSLVTDFTMIKPGSLHIANGGYIVLEAEALLKSYGGWIALKRSLKTQKVSIESLQSLKNQYDIISLTNLEPDEIPLDIKVVLLGSPYIYYLLYNNDEYFREFFKVKAEFDEEIKNCSSNSLKILGFISNYCEENNIPPITRDGVKEILRYSCRSADSRNYYTGRMEKIVDLIEEAAIFSKENKEKQISRKNIKNALKNIERRHGIYKDKTMERYEEGKYIVDTKGYKVGEINGLSVIDIGDFRFGKQSKITVSTYASRSGIVNIEREVDMSGNIHSKGVLVLSGYFNETFGKTNSISFGASICFEQLYGGVDGDSASLAELITLISSLSDIPLNQGIAVTGSVNQKGIVQPVGGLNEKIEGFFEVCKRFGLDGSQGVILPSRNVAELILSDEVIEAVKNGLFHIYPVESIDECFNIICSKELCNSNQGKAYESIKNSVMDKLNLYKKIFSSNSK
ncbi:Lon protease family protein [Clostridium cylindrosporum]|uniref:endopeptidase La n=1 Tax=Clostridium cylindrosporum DSM 605 TaxID=1121307 RepID=A0A0J8DAP9_CLOCY|nr:ATP-binding protein [Clostridium cylindrosporum]KMT21394.1 putative Lon protease [Clostridium cylindrosporum DSM 605]